jgi:hypothetical protein
MPVYRIAVGARAGLQHIHVYGPRMHTLPFGCKGPWACRVFEEASNECTPCIFHLQQFVNKARRCFGRQTSWYKR